MKNVTSKEFFQWLDGQPDDRKIDMSNPLNNDDCGCLLVEFGRDFGIDFKRVGHYDNCLTNEPANYEQEENPIVRFTSEIARLIDACLGAAPFFKEAKEIARFRYSLDYPTEVV